MQMTAFLCYACYKNESCWIHHIEQDELSIPGQLARSKSAERCGSPAATSKGHWPFEAPTEPTGETSSLKGVKGERLAQ